jgi:serine protease AprX
MKKVFVVLVLLLSMLESDAQLTRYIIQFTDKGGSTYSFSAPQAYLSPSSLERRARHKITLDSTDLPVSPAYIDSLRLSGDVTIINASKWLNSVSIQTTDAAALQKIATFSFVKKATPVATRQLSIKPQKDFETFEKSGTQSLQQTAETPFDYGNAAAQINIHNGSFLHNLGLRGQKIGIGMLDAGYFNYTTLKAFDSMNRAGQVKETWDFVARHPSVVEDHHHGMQCLSIIAANIPGQFVGSAPKADFYLYRTEDAATEFPIEEHNWVCAAERVDSAGGQIISSSLGYATFDDPSLNHKYADMNGNTTMAAIGADLAAKKGLLVMIAAGNEGAGGWKYIMTPADGDSVLTVGAVDRSGNIAAFSSYGPTADGQVKPDVVSVGAGTTIQNTNNTIVTGNGTSFACPNMAGLAACLWQGFPQASNMKIIHALRQASSQYVTPDNRKGYGIPDMKKAFQTLLQEEVSISASLNNCGTTISWSSKDAAGMRYEIERKAAGDAEFKKLSQLVVTTPTFGNRSYQFIDGLAEQSTGAIQYRIRQVIDTAAATLTSFIMDTAMVNVVVACNNTSRPMLLFPNPARNHFTLQVNNTEALDNLLVQMRDASGKLVYQKWESKPAAIAVYSIPAYHLAKGKYFVTVYSNGKQLATETLLKL